VEENCLKEHENGPNNDAKMGGKVHICYNLAAEDSVATIYVNVAYLLKARTVESKKQLLPANGSETFVSRQWLGKHVPTATVTHATIEVLLEPVFYCSVRAKELRQLGQQN
jgi:hypothetical protein